MPDIQIEQIPENGTAAERLFVVRVVVHNPDRVRSMFDQIRVYRSTDSTDGTDGTFEELTSSGTRIPIIAGSRNYTYIDTDGRSSYWYRITYYNTKSGTESQASAPQEGLPSPALSIMSVDELKLNYLFGVNLTDDNGSPYPDSLFQHYIEAAAQLVQDKLDITIPETTILDERHDFIKQDYQKYVWMQVLNVPVISVEEVRLVLPTNQTVVTYNNEWLHVDRDSGHIEIVPGSGQVTLGQTGAFLPLVFGGQDYLPQAFRINYTCGFRKVPADIKHAIGMVASFGPLNIAGDLLGGAGIAAQSISMDGISQSLSTTSSATNAGYGARILTYTKELKTMWPTLQQRYHPLRFIVV